MPNGTHMYSDEEWHEVLAFFAKNGEPLTSFALTYGLKIEKYYHDASSWDFEFRHPKGGIAGVELFYKVEDGSVMVSSSWQLDDYDKRTRYLRWSEGGRRRVDPVVGIRGEIAREIMTILEWEPREMTAHPDVGRNWHHQSKEEFERLALRGTSLLRNLLDLKKESNETSSSDESK